MMDNTTLRRYITRLLIAVTAGLMTARIMGVEFVQEPSLYHAYPERKWPTARPEAFPTFSSNDRSRWATVRSLVEKGTFVVGKRVDVKDVSVLFAGGAGMSRLKNYVDEGIAFQDGYKSVDLAMNPKTQEFISTKPPLFTTMVAGEYWLLRTLFGLDLGKAEHRWPVVCTILITFNVLPYILFLLLLANLLEEYGRTDWGRLFVFTAACFGTFLTTFAVTLNNHTPAACCVFFAFYPLLRGRSAEAPSPFSICSLLVSGFFAGLAMCLDLPAAAFTAAVGFVVLVRSPRGLIWFIPAVITPIAAATALNYMVVDTVVPVYSKKESEWYRYEGSHWSKATLNPPPRGIDFVQEPKEVYSFHMTFGHHGVFSLTPIWLLALFGTIWATPPPATLLRLFQRLTLMMTIVLVGFYIFKTNNYEGWTSGPRWQFWLIPLYLMAMLSVADRLSESRSGRGLAYLLLAVAAFSAAYPVWNPWRHPWIYNLCEYMGWLKY